MYSESTGNVYCFHCKLFVNNDSTSSSITKDGFLTWKKSEGKVRSHENSPDHQHCSMKRLYRSIEVLKRVADVVRFLSIRGLAFRGSHEVFGVLNNGNYLGILELIGKFDLVLKVHIENYGNKGRESVINLSKTICEDQL